MNKVDLVEEVAKSVINLKQLYSEAAAAHKKQSII